MISILIRASAETLARVAEQARARGCEITVRGKRGRLHTAVLTCEAIQTWQIYQAAGARRLREERIRCVDHAEAVRLWLPAAEEAATRHLGVVVHISYAARDRALDHVDVRLDGGGIMPCYRCEVTETGPQECAEPEATVRGEAEPTHPRHRP